MYPRQARNTLERLARGFPVLALTGPRQSGKTTLARASFPDKTYISLENLDERHFAEEDPKRFLARFSEGAILDEVQRCPDLLSWLQGVVDDRPVMGQFVLTGSAQFDLLSGVSQSLSGRVGRVELLPLSFSEMQSGGCLPTSLDRLLLDGGYPAIYQRDLAAGDWFSNYVATYLERDVRQIIAVRDLSQFHRFVRLCAARSAQLLNLAALGADCGISAVTAREWLSVLEASYLVRCLPPYFQNFGKRLVKSPKLYFLDVGLMAWLLGIRDETAIATHAARGALFETWVVSEFIKQRFNAGNPADLYFWRNSAQKEIDIVFECSGGLQLVEIKSGSTFAADWTDGFKSFQKGIGKTPTLKPILIYGGADSYTREDCHLRGWQDIELEGTP